MKNELTAAQLVDTYRISLNKDASGNFTGMVRIENAKRCKADKALEAIQAAKQEIIAILQERGETEARARAEHAAKVAAIPGLKEIRSAWEDMAAWRNEFEKNIYNGDSGVGLRKKPEYDMPAMYAAYPVATAYLKAESYAHAANYQKASAGRKAMEAIIDGADPEETIKAMEEEWSAATMAHMWD